MLGVFGALRGLARVRTGVLGVVVCSPVSTLHYRATAPLLLLLALLVSARQYLGEPVQCVQHKSGDDAAVPERVMNTYCFVSTTYTLVQPRYHPQLHHQLTWQQWRHAQGLGVGPDPWSPPAWPGLHAPQGLGHDEDPGATVRRHAYYQWVPLVLLLQAMLFAAPGAAWTHWEGGLVSGALRGLTGPEPDLLPAAERQKRIGVLARYFCGTLNSHGFWAAGYWLAEWLNMLNVVANALLTDTLLGGHFFSYGMDVIAALSGTRSSNAISSPSGYEPQVDPMEAMFPKMTKCTFYKYGASGSMQRHDALCVMALNVVNEKVFVLLWFWLAVLSVVSLMQIVRSSLALLTLACNRRAASRNRLTLWLSGALLGLPALPPSVSGGLSARLDCGDWLFLLLLGCNMRRRAFRALAHDVLFWLDAGVGAGAGAGARPADRLMDGVV